MLFVLNKKVLILFSTMDKMNKKNKISTFIPHLSVALHLFPYTSRETTRVYMPR